MSARVDTDRDAEEPDAAGRAAEYARLHRPFRPVRARRMARAMAAAQFLVLAAVAVLGPSQGAMSFGWYDRVGFVVVGLLVGAFLVALGGVEVQVDERGLVVRNLLVRTRLEWAQVVAVRFGGGQPWASLDLADGETLPVMAVQRADLPAAQDEARRLATLIALHSQPDSDD